MNTVKDKLRSQNTPKIDFVVNQTIYYFVIQNFTKLTLFIRNESIH